MANTKMFVHFSGTVADFKKLSNISDYDNKIVFIKGGTDGKGAAIYTHGSYFANFAEFLTAINFVKGVNVDGQNYNAAAGGGYLAFGATDPSTVAVNAGQNGITIGLTQDFINKVNNTATLAGNTSTALGSTSDAADKDGSVFARIANLAALVSDLTGGETTSIAGQITAAINAIKGTLDTEDAATLEAINDELNAIDAKWAGLAKEVSDSAGTNVVVTVKTKDGKVSDVTVNETGLTNALNSKANAADVYTKTAAETMAQGKVDALANNAVKANTEAIAKLNGNDTVEGSVDKKIKDAINAFAGSADSDNVIENVTELLNYVKGVDGSKTLAEAIAQIADNKGKIETLNGSNTTAGSVAKTVKDAIEAEVERANDAYATTAQGAKADSAVQKTDITTGTANGTIKVQGQAVSVYGLKSAAYTESTAYATSAQGTKADNALQEITKVDSDYATVTVSAKSANKQSVKVDVKVKAVADATAAKQGFADAYDVNQSVAGAKAYADALFAWEEL
jgi:hypothetical protein